MNQSTTHNRPALEEQLKEKLEQYYRAEAEGKPRDELSLIYRELKELNYQIAFSKNRYQFS